MFGGIDPKKMQAMMRQMGIKQEEVECLRVVIERADGKTVIEPANVVRVTMQGNDSWQISGEAREEGAISESDIEMVMEKTGKSAKEAKSALEKNGGDIAEAIISLT